MKKFWKFLEKKKPDVQCRALIIFDYYEPIDWEIEPYFNKHPEIRKLCFEKYNMKEKAQDNDG
jgi:hypothetical protein